MLVERGCGGLLVGGIGWDSENCEESGDIEDFGLARSWGWVDMVHNYLFLDYLLSLFH